MQNFWGFDFTAKASFFQKIISKYTYYKYFYYFCRVILKLKTF